MATLPTEIKVTVDLSDDAKELIIELIEALEENQSARDVATKKSFSFDFGEVGGGPGSLFETIFNPNPSNQPTPLRVGEQVRIKEEHWASAGELFTVTDVVTSEHPNKRANYFVMGDSNGWGAWANMVERLDGPPVCRYL